MNGSDNFINSSLTRSRHARTNWKSTDKLFKEELDVFMHKKSQTSENPPYPIYSILQKIKNLDHA